MYVKWGPNFLHHAVYDKTFERKGFAVHVQSLMHAENVVIIKKFSSIVNGIDYRLANRSHVICEPSCKYEAMIALTLVDIF